MAGIRNHVLRIEFQGIFRSANMALYYESNYLTFQMLGNLSE